MANVNAPFGLKPYFGADGSSPTWGLNSRPRLIAYDNATKIYKGDPVKQLDTGYVAQWTASTAVSQMAGIFWGCEYPSGSTKQPYFNNYWPGADVASTGQVKAFVIPVNTSTPPMFVVQTGNSNTTATAVTMAAIGQNADLAMGTGNTLSGQSGAYLDINTFGTTATLPFRIVALYDGPGNDNTSAYNLVIVQANIYQETGI